MLGILTFAFDFWGAALRVLWSSVLRLLTEVFLPRLVLGLWSNARAAGTPHRPEPLGRLSHWGSSAGFFFVAVGMGLPSQNDALTMVSPCLSSGDCWWLWISRLCCFLGFK